MNPKSTARAATQTLAGRIFFQVVSMASISQVAELLACSRLLRQAISRIERCVGPARAGAAIIPLLQATAEIGEMRRWAAEQAQAKAHHASAEVGSEVFNLSEAELRAAWGQ